MKNAMVRVVFSKKNCLFKINQSILMLFSCYLSVQAGGWYLEDVYFLHKRDEPDWVRPKHVIENEKNKTLQLTPIQEYELINAQVLASEVLFLFLSVFFLLFLYLEIGFSMYLEF